MNTFKSQSGKLYECVAQSESREEVPPKVVETPWDQAAITEGIKYPGLPDPYKPGGAKIFKQGYLDLGLVKPGMSRSYYAFSEHVVEYVLMLLLAKNGVAFIRDPEGVLELVDGNLLKNMPKRVREHLAGAYHEAASYAQEAMNDDEAQKLMGKAALAMKATVTIKAVQGKTGAGYKVVMSPVRPFVKGPGSFMP